MKRSARTAPQSAEDQVVDSLQRFGPSSKVPPHILRQVAAEWVAGLPPSAEAVLTPELTQQLAEKALRLAAVTTEEQVIRAKLATKLGSTLGDIDQIVHRHFEGATRDIAERHFEATRLERARRITTGVLVALGGEGATLESVLTGAARAVTKPVTEAVQATKGLDAAVTAQLAQAVSQAVQQVALNVQKIISVALESERSGDTTHPKYYYP